MKLIRGLDRWPAHSPCVATIGNFDGVHCGHQVMFADLAEIATARGLPSCVISFDPLPHEYFAPDAAPPRLQGLRDRVTSIRDCGMDRFLMLDFNAALAAQSAEDFVSDTLLTQLGVRHLIVGDDFRFGYRRRGDVALLQSVAERGQFTVQQTTTVEVAGARVSSTRVRECLGSGNLTLAAELLGRPYRISGRVIHGEKVGRQLGFPTANIALGTHRPPLRGVMAVSVHDTQSGTRHPAVANLGERPTVGGRKLLLEVHLLNGEHALYAHHLQVDFLHWLRGERRFDSLDALKTQIALDADAAHQALAM